MEEYKLRPSARARELLEGFLVEYGLAPAEGFDLPAILKDFTYMGTVVKTALDLRDGMEVKFSRFEQDYGLREGEQLFLRWSPEKSVAIKKSAAAQ